MSSISGDTSSVTGAALTPAQLLDSALVGKPGSASTDQASLSTHATPQQQVDATLLDVAGGSAGTVASDLEAGVPPDLTAASALVSDLASNITAQGSGASAVYSLLSAQSTLKLTK